MDLPPWFYTAGWIFMAVWFFIIEGLALADKDSDDTLSEHLRKWLGTLKGAPIGHKILGSAVFIGFFVWFIPHILLG